MALSAKNKNSQLFSAAVLAIIAAIPLGAAYYFYTDAPLASVFFGTFLASFAAFCAMLNCRRREAFIVLALFIFKFALTAYQALNKNLPLGGEDWGNFHYGAITLINDTGGNIFQMLFGGKKDLFTEIVAVIYRIFGAHTRQINLYVLAASFVASNYVFKTAYLITDGDYYSSALSMLVFSVWPIDIIYSVTYLREMPIQMLVIVSFYFFIRYLKEHRFSLLVMSFIPIAAACMMHSGVIAFAVLYIVCLPLRERDSFSEVFKPKNLAVITCVTVVLMLTPIWDSMFAKIGDFSTIDDVVNRVGQIIEGDASTRYISDMPENGIQLFIQMPYRALLFAFVPLPWMIISFDTAISWVLDALPQVFFVYRMVCLVRMSKANKRIRLLVTVFLIAVAGTYIVGGMGTTAYGNAIRHRAKILPVVIVFVIGLYSYIQDQERREVRENHRNNPGLQRR